MYHDFLGQRGFKGHIWIHKNKKKNILIDNIYCERGFIYILGDPGPQCGMGTVAAVRAQLYGNFGRNVK